MAINEGWALGESTCIKSGISLQVNIPKAIRKALSLERGDIVKLMVRKIGTKSKFHRKINARKLQMNTLKDPFSGGISSK